MQQVVSDDGTSQRTEREPFPAVEALLLFGPQRWVSVGLAVKVRVPGIHGKQPPSYTCSIVNRIIHRVIPTQAGMTRCL